MGCCLFLRRRGLPSVPVPLVGAPPTGQRCLFLPHAQDQWILVSASSAAAVRPELAPLWLFSFFAKPCWRNGWDVVPNLSCPRRHLLHIWVTTKPGSPASQSSSCMSSEGLWKELREDTHLPPKCKPAAPEGPGRACHWNPVSCLPQASALWQLKLRFSGRLSRF